MITALLIFAYVAVGIAFLDDFLKGITTNDTAAEHIAVLLIGILIFSGWPIVLLYIMVARFLNGLKA